MNCLESMTLKTLDRWEMKEYNPDNRIHKLFALFQESAGSEPEVPRGFQE